MRLRPLVMMWLLSVVLGENRALADCGSYPLPVTGAWDPQFQALDDYAQQWVLENGNNAATLAVTYDKRLVYERGFGYQDSSCTQQILPNARMRLATNSCAMTRRALQQLIADGYLSPTTNVQQYLSTYFTFPAGPDPREQQIRVEDIYNLLTCTVDGDQYLDNDQVGSLLGLGRPATATERIQYLWANPLHLMNQSSCVVGQATNNAFSHVSHEIAAMIIATAYWHSSGNSGYNPSALTNATGIGTWYGNYMTNVLGPHIGVTFFQAGDVYPGSPGSGVTIPGEIWYDSAADAQQCPEWNYWACQINKTAPPVPSAYHRDFFARPGSGTIVAAARDVARFMVSYEWATDNSVLTNSSYALSNRTGTGKPWGCCLNGSLEGTYTQMGDGMTTYGGQNHFWNWVLLSNRSKQSDTSDFDISATLDQHDGTGIFEKYQPTTDLFEDVVLYNRWYGQYATVSHNGFNTPYLAYSSSLQTNSGNPFFPYSQLPSPWQTFRILPDPNNYIQIGVEAPGIGSSATVNTYGMVLSNEHNLADIEILGPNNTWWSEEFTKSPVSGTDYYQILTRWWAGNGLHVQDQTGAVEQGRVQPGWWSADWELKPAHSGICCTNMTSDVSCPAGSAPCACGQPGCPAYAPSNPCAGLCSNPTLFTASNFQANSIGTGATCYETTAPIHGGTCGNLVSPRKLTVNGATMTCNNANWSKIPASVNGGYCIQTTSGDYAYAYFTTW